MVFKLPGLCKGSRVYDFGAGEIEDFNLGDARVLIKVRRMRYSDVIAVAKGMQKANENDPIWRYMRDTPDSRDGPRFQKVYHIVLSLGVASAVRHGVALTVRGHAMAVFGLPSTRRPRSKKPFDIFLSGIIRLVQKYFQSFDTKEQAKRAKEVDDTIAQLIEQELGKTAAEMASVDAVATDPDFQGRGWGGALVDTISAMGDRLGKPTYLVSSNVANNEFYNSHGFYTVAYRMVGDGNLNWKGSPIPLQLMVRKPGGQKLEMKA